MVVQLTHRNNRLSYIVKASTGQKQHRVYLYVYISAKIKEHYGLLSLEPFATLILINSVPTAGMQNGSHRKATKGSCDNQQFVPASLSCRLYGGLVHLEPLPLKVVGVLPPQALGVLPDVGTF